MSSEHLSTILLVDDDERQRQLLSNILSIEGYAIVQARDGQEALDLLRGGTHPSVIVLDLMMPRMDGWELMKRIANDEPLGSIPIVVAAASESNVPRNTVAVHKPVKLEHLLHALKYFCTIGARSGNHNAIVAF